MLQRQLYRYWSPPIDCPVQNNAINADVIRSSKSRFDAILLDVDNSCDSFTFSHNSWLYTPEGLAATHHSLRTRGSLAIWSVSSQGAFQGRLRKAGFTPSIHPVRGHNKSGGHYYILLGQKNAA